MPGSLVALAVAGPLRAALRAVSAGQEAPVLLVLPADHVIGDRDAFQKAVTTAAAGRRSER